mgnify:CR=1 FL=1
MNKVGVVPKMVGFKVPVNHTYIIVAKSCPTEDAVMKSVYLAIREATKKWSVHIRNRGIKLNQSLTIYEKRGRLWIKVEPTLFSTYTVSGIVYGIISNRYVGTDYNLAEPARKNTRSGPVQT